YEIFTWLEFRRVLFRSAGLALGPNGGRGPLGRVAVAPGRRDVRSGRPAAGRGPLWFQKMDRNRDGDVSRKEFIGTDEQFKAIDRSEERRVGEERRVERV